MKKVYALILLAIFLFNYSSAQQWLGGNTTNSVLHHNGGVYVGPYNSTWESTKYDSTRNIFMSAWPARIESSLDPNIYSDVLDVVSDVQNIPSRNNDVLWVAIRYYQPKDVGLLTVSSKDISNVPYKVFTVRSNGRVGIGVDSPRYLLDVNGVIHSKEVKVDITDWPDYVFKDDYKLIPLQSLATFIRNNGHLPDLPTADEVNKKGFFLSKISSQLLKKIEELTIYNIQADDKLILQDYSMKELRIQFEDQQTEIKGLKEKYQRQNEYYDGAIKNLNQQIKLLIKELKTL